MNPIIRKGIELKHTFNNIETLTEEYIDGTILRKDKLTWNLSIRTETKDNSKFLSCYLTLVGQRLIPMSVCEVNATFTILKDDQIVHSSKFASPLCYTMKNKSWGFPTFIEWSKLVSNGYIHDNSITIGVKFDYKLYKFDLDWDYFRDYRVNFYDGAFYVNKQFVSMFSEYLTEEFKKYPDFYEIEDVDANEFALLYAAIHPDPIKITENTFVTLLDLSSRFKIDKLFKKCMEKGLKSKSLPLIEKIRGAEKLEPENELMKGCLNWLKTPKEFKIFVENPDFQTLKDTTRVKIFLALVNVIS